MDSLVWIEFDGVIVKQSRTCVWLRGPQVPGAMGLTPIPRSCLGRILFTNGTWQEAIDGKRAVELPLGKAVCVLEIADNFARKIGLA